LSTKNKDGNRRPEGNVKQNPERIKEKAVYAGKMKLKEKGPSIKDQLKKT